MIMSLKEHECFVVSMIVFVIIWYFSEERVKEIDNVDNSELIQRKEEQIQSESENDGKEFVVNIGLQYYNNIQFELILDYQIDGSFHAPVSWM